MLVELVYKEFKKEYSSFNSNIWIKVLKLLLRLVFVALLITLEVFIFKSLDKKIVTYSSYGTYDFLVLFLFLMSVVGIVSSLISARKIIFDKEDARLLSPLPISPSTIVFSKMTYVYVKDVLLNLVISTPLLITFASSRFFMPYFYVASIIYPLIISAFNVGVALILVTPYEFIYKLVKSNDIVQFVLASVIVVVLCFIYQFVLNLFLTALNDSSIGGMFSTSFIESLHNLVKYLLPVNNFTSLIVNKENILPNVCIILGLILVVLSLGGILSTYFFKFLNQRDISIRRKNKKSNIKLITPFKALLIKEMDLLFKDSTYIFSYTALLIMAPFLSYVVISSMNSIMYTNLKFYTSIFPEVLEGINMCIVLLFASIINASASLSFSREEKCIQIVKYIPVSIKLQLVAKTLIPLILSSFSLVVSLFVLVVSKNINVTTFFISLIIGLILTFFNNVFGTYLDMLDKGSRKNKISYLNPLIASVFPLILLIIHFVFGFMKVHIALIYFIEIALSLLLVLPLIIRCKTKYNKAFKQMEVS